MILCILILALNIQFVKAEGGEVQTIKTKAIEGPSKVAVMVGDLLTYETPLINIKRLLEHQGLIYDVVRDRDFSEEKIGLYSVLIVIGSSQPIHISEDALREHVGNGGGLIWIGEALPDSLHSLFGMQEASGGEALQTITLIRYEDASTRIFNENLHFVKPSGASIHGSFINELNQTASPSELSHRINVTSGLTYFFAYDVYAWWCADLDVPWIRPYRLQLALEEVISDHHTVRLAPYPRNMRSAFIVRIEDVDPLHNSVDWLSRADRYLEYYTERKAPLTVSLIPTYLEPSAGLEVKLGDATMLTRWLSKVVISGGTIVEHGFTHQHGVRKTGVASEFLIEDDDTWLSLDEQMDRINQGAEQIDSILAFKVKGFEAPHYVANSDTYEALRRLGFKYVTHNNENPYFDRYGSADGMLNIPETLGYIPLNPSIDVEPKMIFNIEMLYDMGGVMLFFNHLFDDEALQIGEDLLEYVVTKQGVWYTNSDNIADFWLQRANAYSKMDVQQDDKIRVTLGSSIRAGLTLVLKEDDEIKRVSVNGEPWPVFNENYVILPVLLRDSNNIIIDLSESECNSNLYHGSLMLVCSSFFSIIFYELNKLNTRKLP